MATAAASACRRQAGLGVAGAERQLATAGTVQPRVRVDGARGHQWSSSNSRYTSDGMTPYTLDTPGLQTDPEQLFWIARLGRFSHGLAHGPHGPGRQRVVGVSCMQESRQGSKVGEQQAQNETPWHACTAADVLPRVASMEGGLPRLLPGSSNGCTCL